MTNIFKIFVGVITLLTIFSCGSSKQNFSFFAIGDMPYNVPEDYERFEHVITAINEQDPAFTVHVGDIKGGSSPCTDAVFEKLYDYFQEFKNPVILTPGDNDWTDCHRKGAGEYDPVERLEQLRSVFYKDRKSMGQTKLDLHTQDTYPGYEKFVENALWEQKKILFATLHVVGSNNNFNPDNPADNTEFNERNTANLFWLEEVFRQAKNRNSQGLVLFLHAGMNYADSDQSGFKDFTKKLRQEVLNYENPVLLVYGDHHRFLIEKPLRNDDGRVVKNFTSLMVFGNPDMHAVQISVNRKYDALFEIRQHFIKEAE
ncbi:metallophosphoesterase [Membranicola marinus]|uniref:Metallophosphoesterase n=1 Tax=Membranihabitans marinus TaxID=1227546 RepID=A0A953HYB5_9BACT|nr:metallophosphoesterase [Membranihabitans marinus]MBY5957962.1 metallophosphoesterase [Membranihabitans marinus]